MIVWLDLETTGLSPNGCRIIEVAAIKTDDALEEQGRFVELIQPPGYAHWEQSTLAMHRESGLAALASEFGVPLAPVAEALVEFIGGGKPYLGGSSVHFDRAFLRRWMPGAESLLHYRNIDVSSLKALTNCAIAGSLESDIPLPPGLKGKQHRAMADVEDSLLAARFYAEMLRMAGVEAAKMAAREGLSDQ